MFRLYARNEIKLLGYQLYKEKKLVSLKDVPKKQLVPFVPNKIRITRNYLWLYTFFQTLLLGLIIGILEMMSSTILDKIEEYDFFHEKIFEISNILILVFLCLYLLFHIIINMTYDIYSCFTCFIALLFIFFFSFILQVL